MVDDVLNKIDLNGYKYFCVIYPTSPLLKKKDLIKAINRLKLDKTAKGIFSIGKFQSNPLRSLKFEKKFMKFENKKYQKKNSNNLPEFFFDAGNFYFFKIKDYLRSKIFINSKMLGFILPQERAIDINNKEDLILAKKLFKFL